MKKNYAQVLAVLVIVVGISVIVVLNLTKSVELIFESESEVIANEEQSYVQTPPTETSEERSDVTAIPEEALLAFAQDLGVSLKDIVSVDFASGEYSWVNGYDESMLGYYQTILDLNLRPKDELADYINAVARGNYRMEIFRIKVLEKEGLSIVNWDENQKTFEYLPGYSRYSIAELYYKKYPEKRNVDSDSYYLENALN
ncbi:hypothetical protein EVJ20_13015 [Exiguobacterium sp. SH0S1]|uniref:hypothetical protein n=1 Tax=Exiguobacterium sp. SH0S1 TaxID=2510949 RepID=UPI00103BE915|nr:hypothetical protein [Exiguobacterium sp. SH0S1]TCI75893.1 hypothetical protein EVJ20_13015 [Exiguobacterium sp. SH0S1]